MKVEFTDAYLKGITFKKSDKYGDRTNLYVQDGRDEYTVALKGNAVEQFKPKTIIPKMVIECTAIITKFGLLFKQQ